MVFNFIVHLVNNFLKGGVVTVVTPFFLIFAAKTFEGFLDLCTAFNKVDELIVKDDKCHNIAPVATYFHKVKTACIFSFQFLPVQELFAGRVKSNACVSIDFSISFWNHESKLHVVQIVGSNLDNSSMTNLTDKFSS